MSGPPPRPPTLDRPRADAALARLAAAVRSCLDTLVAGKPEPDTPINAGCRLVAWIVADAPRAYARRDAAGVEKVARELEGLASRMPGHLAGLQTPGAWAARGPIDVDLGISSRRRGRR